MTVKEVRMKNLKRRFWHMAAVALVAAGLFNVAAFAQTTTNDTRNLTFGRSLERRMKRGEIHQYKLSLRQGQILFVELRELMFDVKVGLLKSSDQTSVAKANLGGGVDREEMIVVAEEGGEYLLRVDASETQFGDGSYRFSARLADTLTEKDKTRIEALKLLSEAVALQKENTAVGIRAAIAKRERALALWQRIGDKYWEGRTQDRLGTAHNLLLENNQAVDCLDRALQIVKASKDKPLEAATLNTIGSMANGFGEYQQAIDYHNQALRIFQKMKTDIGIMSSLMFLGNVSIELKDYPKASDYFQQSLDVARKRSNQNVEAACLYALGAVLDAQNEKQKALEKYNPALALWREIKNNDGTALALLKIGTIQTAQSETDKALDNLREALRLSQTQKNRALEVSAYFALSSLQSKLKRVAEAIDLYKKALAYYQEFNFKIFQIILMGTIAIYYDNLPDRKEAIKYAEAALAIEEAVPERCSKDLTKRYQDQMRNSKAMTLQHLGRIYFNSGDMEKALQYNYQVLEEFEKKDDKDSKHRAIDSLHLIAEIHQYRYEWDKALENYHRALAIAEALNDKPRTYLTLNSMGLVYSSTAEKKGALEAYTKALEVIRLIPEKGDLDNNIEASIIDNIGTAHLFLGEPKKALEFHNQALEIRQRIKDPDFIDGQATTYLNLAAVQAFLGENQRAIALLNKALELYRQAPQRVKDLARNRTTEASILNNLGAQYKDLGNFRKALEYYDQTLQMAVARKREGMEATALNNMALVYQAFGEPRRALQNFNRALELNRKVGSILFDSTLLNNTGQVYSDLGDERENIKYTTQALTIAEKVGNKEGITTYLNNLGRAYRVLSENDKALGYMERALAIARKTGNKSSEATSLNNLATLFSNTGERGKAVDYFEQALVLIRSIGERAAEATFLGNMAVDYLELGETRTALEYREKSLGISREIGDKAGETYQLNGIGTIHRIIGEQNKNPEQLKQALTYYEQALKLSRETESKSNEADALLGMAKAYIELGETTKALPQLSKVLDYSREYQSRTSEDAAYFALGTLHEKNRAFDQATEAYQHALTVACTITDLDIEAKALRGLMSAWKARGNQPLAIYYGKQSVNTYQQLRGLIRNLKRETQNLYRDKVTDAYRELADLLISAGRLPEAEPVLAMLKQQEAFEFVRRDAGEADLLSKNVGLDEKEGKALAEYAHLADELTAASQRLKDMELQGVDDQSEEYKKLKREVDEATKGVRVFFKKLETEFTKKAADGETVTAGSVDSLRADLRRVGPGVVLISTYLLPERYRAILNTGDTLIDRKTEYRPLGLDGEKINRKIMEFKQALQNPNLDPRPLGKELYDIFFKPLEKDLEHARARTLLWSLDGSLRYVPMAALYDGSKYLAERYQNVFVTLGRTTTTFNQPTHAAWHVLGLGVSKKYEGFSELPAVSLELKTIVQDERVAQETGGVLPGIRLLDSDFTVQSFTRYLRTPPDGRIFNLVHLATHFLLGSNLDNSGLLLGNGKMLSLYTIDKDSSFDFKDVELLTLSACETGVTVDNSNGSEVESLGMIAQRNGAKAILATLWKVADESTALFISDFYRLRKESPQLTKAEAMQMAQRAMLQGQYKAGETPLWRGPVAAAGKNSPLPPFRRDANTPYAHPYFWSPFVLIGNWR